MITELELKLINRIIHDEYTSLNGGTPDEYDDIRHGVWCNIEWFSQDIGISVPACKGVLGSLVKKDLAWVQDDGDGDTVGITEEGYKLWKEGVK